MHEVFNKLFGGMAQRNGFCVECLSSIFGEPVEKIKGYLEGAESTTAECDNCWERREAFRIHPS